jgi:hypothetical protein
MPITHRIWIEIERCDDENGTYENVEGEPQVGSVAEFDDLDEAIRFAERLHATGERLSNEYDHTEGDDT